MANYEKPDWKLRREQAEAAGWRFKVDPENELIALIARPGEDYLRYSMLGRDALDDAGVPPAVPT